MNIKEFKDDYNLTDTAIGEIIGKSRIAVWKKINGQISVSQDDENKIKAWIKKNSKKHL